MGNPAKICTGSLVRFSEHPGDSVRVRLDPSVVRERMLKPSEDDMLELPSYEDENVPAFVDRYEIIAVIPVWEIAPSV